jgi:hypothetical protein
MHPDVGAEHGRGLLLVEAMSTAWGVVKADVGKTVWAEFSVSPVPTCAGPISREHGS